MTRTRLTALVSGSLLLLAPGLHGCDTARPGPASSAQAPTLVAVDAEYFIPNPVVWRRVMEIPQITFQEGDLVWVSAGGCVQTRGTGRTWKRYVDPLGDDSKRLYHGRVWIPGATVGLETLRSVINRSPVQVGRLPPGADPSQLFLRLGYDDDNYSDNSYLDHDDGSYDQCVGQFGAWVQVSILHQPPSATSPAACPAGAALPVDLYWDGLDANLWPLNPRWGSQCASPTNYPENGLACNWFRWIPGFDVLDLGPSCTRSLPTVDNNDVFLGLACNGTNGGVSGHVNFGWATYTGTLYWNNFSGCGIGEDCDFNFNLVPPNGEGIAAEHELAGNPAVPAIGLEMNEWETVGTTGAQYVRYWRDLFQFDDAFRHAHVDGKHAIVSGVLGFDAVHGDETEIHPILGMAIQLAAEPAAHAWAILARRSGNEGGCSSTDLIPIHDGGNSELRYLLDPITFPNPIVGAGTQFRNADGSRAPYTVDLGPGGTLLRIPLPDPHSTVLAELHVNRLDPPAQCGTLWGGQGLRAGQSLWSCDGRFFLAMQTDGNLVLYKNGVGPKWASNTWSTAAGGDYAVMEPNGDLVVYRIGDFMWGAGTWGYTGAHAALQNDGNLVIYDAAGIARWATNTAEPRPPPPPPDPLGCPRPRGAVCP